MEQQSQAARLQDIISYTPETYFTDDEVNLIRTSFNGVQGSRLLKVIRKCLLPTISDPEMPVEEFGKDMFMAQVDFKNLNNDEVKPIALGLQLAAKIIAGSLIQLRNIANIKEETNAERLARQAKNSSK